ncbi:MAG: hypothetical protein M1602_05490, partial [Firmicutes bacterium]|nr:hypothetical protein [Bacillota bacterium]
MPTHNRRPTIATAVIIAILIGAFSVRSRSATVASELAQPDDNAVVSPLATAPTSQPPAEPRPVEERLVAYSGPIEHIFFHPLIAYPELAFDNDSLARGYDDWFIT